MSKSDPSKIATGLLFGSFNPLHIGHIMIANWMCAFENMEEAWLVVTPSVTGKREQKNNLANASLRLEMVSRYCLPYPQIFPSDIEFRLDEPHFAIHTVQALKERYPDRVFTLLLGEDKWTGFQGWYKSEQLLREVEIVIYPRDGHRQENKDQIYPIGVRKTEAPLLGISSTLIRKALREKRDIRSFLPPGEYEYLLEHKIYE